MPQQAVAFLVHADIICSMDASVSEGLVLCGEDVKAVPEILDLRSAVFCVVPQSGGFETRGPTKPIRMPSVTSRVPTVILQSVLNGGS